MIEIENVSKCFGELKVLDGVSLTVNKGEVVSIIGGSGSGKSTLLMCINGLEPIQGGRILVDGTEVHAKATDLNKLRQQDRHRVPAVERLPASDGAGERHAGAAQGAGQDRATRPSDRAGRSSSMSGSATSSTSIPASFPAASSSAWRSPARWRWSRNTCCSTR